MTTETTIYDEVAQFLATLSAEKVLDYHLPEPVKLRLRILLEKQQTEVLTADEKREVEYHLIVNNILSLAKAKARCMLSAAF